MSRHPVGHGLVIETRGDLVTVQLAGSSVMVNFAPKDLGLETGHDLALNSKVTIWSDGTYWPAGLQPPEPKPPEAEPPYAA